jgi:hypothetical protein
MFLETMKNIQKISQKKNFGKIAGNLDVYIPAVGKRFNSPLI